MSITVTTDVFCDDCSNWIFGDASHKIRKNYARKIAKKNGWKHFKSPITEKMIDVCPKCWKWYESYMKN